MSVQVRLARSDDADLIHRITQAAFAEYRGALPVEPGALTETVADVAAALRQGGAVLATIDGEHAGAARFVREDEDLYVGRVAVLPSHRRQGVASAMMGYLEQLAPSLGCAAVRIGVRESLPSNVALYQTLGYEVVKIEPHPRGPDRSFTMRKLVAAHA
ncbi:MAG: GNAT family N-acetyltransferase [Chloroflexi bacterium]|nr:GNAT family N-acetyltransferase [Chloroflexota bacterium]